MSNDPLDRDVSLGIEITPTGLNVKAKSRLVAAIERFFGNIVEYGNIPMERHHARERADIELDQAKRDGERQLVEAMTKATIEKINMDPVFAERAIRNHLDRITSRQENKDGVVRQAIEDLRRDPAADEGGDKVDPVFLDRLERHAEDASTDELREKWGRVLAGEIRKPGTFSPKVMRIVDEIDQRTAALFEKVCDFRIGNVLPRCLVGELPMTDVAQMVGAGLVLEPGPTGQVVSFAEAESDGRKLWMLTFGEHGFSIENDGPFRSPRHNRNGPILAQEQRPNVPVYLLTNSGRVLASILPDKQDAAAARLAGQLASAVNPKHLMRLRDAGDGKWMSV